jgi:uncharacterized protein
MILENRNEPANIRKLHPDLFEVLLDNNFIVPSDMEEWQMVLQEWGREDNDPGKITIIVNPSLSCNMRCWYCYETHFISDMSSEIQEGIVNIVRNKVHDASLQSVNLDFFGGEPLLSYEACVRPIVQNIYNVCKANNKRFFLSFTTNGYLLTDDIFEDFDRVAQFGNVKLQITLDGNRIYHNKVRKTREREFTYDRIVQNVKKALRHKVSVLLRLNYTEENIRSFYDVIDEFCEIQLDVKREKLVIACHRIWQSPDSLQLREEVRNLVKAFRDVDFTVEEPFLLSKDRCYADRLNTIVVNYDGGIYKCTARDFTTQKRDGYLNNDGHIVWDTPHQERISSMEKFTYCYRCPIFPLCHAGCSQNRMETSHTDTCMKGYTQEQIQQLLYHRAKYLIQRFQYSH